MISALGVGIRSVEAELYDLTGRALIRAQSRGASLALAIETAQGALANGAYLYLVTVLGTGGRVVRTGVSKLVVIR
jgi:hypothetical protein